MSKVGSQIIFSWLYANNGRMAHRHRQRRAIDLFRRNAVAERKHEDLARDPATLELPTVRQELAFYVGD